MEVSRATAIANAGDDVRRETWRLLDSCLIVDLTDRILRTAATLTSPAVRTLDAIHLASARNVEPDEVLAYDRRLRDAAQALGLVVIHPGIGQAT